MDKKIEKILQIWHKHFSDKKHQYSEFEFSDIEYFVGCMLYNRFDFSKALSTMKSMDLSYDFLQECGEAEYDEIINIINSIDFKDEIKNLEFLLEYVEWAKSKYSASELYLLNRLHNHIKTLQKIYLEDLEVRRVDFVALNKRVIR
ncbi:MAG: hypothetical protein QG559_1124 [Campylobacterota bacterium]|nr:hypothetical protein [Campylobacterota bacterium]